MRRILAALLALASIGCSTRSLNTFEDIKEGAMALTGKPVTAEIRLERILTAHDRTDSASWPLLPTPSGESQLRWVLRDIEKLESIEFRKLTPRIATILLLGDVASRSQSALVRARAVVAVARLGRSLAPDSGTEPKVVDEALLRSLFEGIKQADAAVPPAGEPDTPELAASRREALLSLARHRFWPPRSFERPAGGREDSFIAGRKWSRVMLDLPCGDRFVADRTDEVFGPAHDALLTGLAAETIRYTVAYGALRDSDVTVRYDAIGALEEIGTPDLTPVLATVAAAEDARLVRFRCAVALGRVGVGDEATAVPALVELLSDLEASVRHAAHESLVAIAGEDLGLESSAWVTWWSTRRIREGDS